MQAGFIPLLAGREGHLAIEQVNINKKMSVSVPHLNAFLLEKRFESSAYFSH